MYTIDSPGTFPRGHPMKPNNFSNQLIQTLQPIQQPAKALKQNSQTVGPLSEINSQTSNKLFKRRRDHSKQSKQNSKQKYHQYGTIPHQSSDSRPAPSVQGSHSKPLANGNHSKNNLSLNMNKPPLERNSVISSQKKINKHKVGRSVQMNNKFNHSGVSMKGIDKS